MKTLYKVAQEIGVNYATLYKRFKNSELINFATKDDNGKLIISDDTEIVIRNWYIKPKGEIEELRTKNEKLEKRVHELTDELISLNKQVVELTKSAHILLGMEQQNKIKMIESNTKKSFWNIFKNKKTM
jgi:AcrR family transcriptional regulator